MQPTSEPLSIIIAVYNEEKSLSELHALIKENTAHLSYEIIFVDDGSTDNSYAILKKMADDHDNVRFFSFRRNMGKSAALDLGFNKAKHPIVVTLDADLQDDPKEIPRLLDKLNEGYDLVSGWKRDRQDPLEKKIPSLFFNKIVALISGIPLHDFNSGFKAYKKTVVDVIALYGEMHRFIPVLACEYGFRVTECEVVHHRRLYGKSKFGFNRYFKGFFDFISVTFLMRYARRPMHFIGSIFLSLFSFGTILLFYSLLKKFVFQETGVRPALFVGLFLLTTAIQVLLTGIVAELFIHFFHNTKISTQNYLKFSSDK